MASHPETIRAIVEQMHPLDVWTRPMFGEHRLYCDGIFVGVICRDTLFLKRNAVTDDALGVEGLAPPYDGARDHHVVSEKLLRTEDAFLCDVVAGTVKVLPPPRKRR